MVPAMPAATFGHEVLFQARERPPCDACGEEMPPPAEEGDLGSPEDWGTGVHLRLQGDGVVLQSLPLCPACAAAIGLTAQAEWAAEDDGG